MRFMTRGLAACSLTLLLGAIGCGDDGGGGGMDAAVDTPADTSMASTVVGTIAVIDTRVFLGPAPGTIIAAGPVVSVGYEDTKEPAPDPVFDTLGVTTGCVVTVYDTAKGEKERTIVDEGTFTIGDGDTADAIPAPKLPIGQCAFDTTLKNYRCLLASGPINAGSNASPNGDGTYTLTITPAPFMNLNVTGSHVIIEGFTDPAYNSVPGDPKKAMFPIVDKAGNGVITVLNPAVTNAETVMGNNAKFTIVTGAAPIKTTEPGNDNFPSLAELDFLGDNSMANQISITKTKGNTVGEFSAKLPPSGEGFALKTDGSSVLPFALPQNADADLIFDCAGSCGSKGGQIFGLLISGRTTDGDLAGTGPTDMPPPKANGKFAEFQCRQINAEQIKLPKEAYAAILGASPTRIETRVMHITADTSHLPETAIASGHAAVGYTDITPPAVQPAKR